jgi:hypothetical protein
MEKAAICGFFYFCASISVLGAVRRFYVMAGFFVTI